MKKSKLAINTLFLYIMQFGGYFFSLIVVPYQTRIISVEHNSQLSVAVGLMLYVQMVIQFGFTVSGVKNVAEMRHDTECLRKIYSSILNVRIVLSLLSFAAIALFSFSVESYRSIIYVIMAYFVAVVFESITPTYLIRGLEDMKTVAVASLMSKVVMLVVVMMFLKEDRQYMMIPVSRLLAAIFSFLYTTFYLHLKYSIRYVGINFKSMWNETCDSLQYFVSRIASSVYRGTNSIALSILSPASMAIYTMPEKLMSIVMAMSSPVADSLLPYMVRKKDYNIIKKLLMMFTMLLMVVGVIVVIFADWIVTFLFGSAYSASANILRIMVPAMVVTPINYIIAFPLLVPMGYAKQSNMANVAAAILHAIILGLLLLTKTMNFYTAAALITFSEVFVTVWRVALVIMHRNEISQE